MRAGVDDFGTTLVLRKIPLHTQKDEMWVKRKQLPFEQHLRWCGGVFLCDRCQHGIVEQLRATTVHAGTALEHTQ